MEIKNKTASPLFKNILILLAILFAWMFCSSLFFKKNKKTPTESVQQAKLVESKESIELLISRKNYDKLKDKRDAALIAGVLRTSDEDLVKATIQYKGDQHKGEIRLKGDWTDHLKDDKWSFRVKIKGENTVEGMRKFSLQHPQTRNYTSEWLFHKLLAEEDILHLRYFFVNAVLTIQDELGEEQIDLGYYAVEEFFEKRLIEHNQRREGLIIKIDEDPLWQERQAFMSNNMNLEELHRIQLSDYQNLSILPYGEGRIKEDSVLYKQFLTAKGLLEGYISQKLSISEVFDVEKLAKYNVICNLLGADHALIGHNYRFYYNPINSRLEPVGFDAVGGIKSYWFSLYDHAHEDEVYLETYLRTLEEFSSEAYFQKMLHTEGLREQVNLLETAYPSYQWDSTFLQHNKNLANFYLFPGKSLNIFLEKFDKNRITVLIENYNRFPAQILALETKKGRSFGTLKEPVQIAPKARERVEFQLNENYLRLFIKKKKKKANIDLAQDLENMLVSYKTLGTERKLSNPILAWPKENQSISETDIFRKEPTVAKFDFLETDTINKIIRWKVGDWRLTETLIVPPNYTLQIGAGTRIGLVTHLASIISFSPVEILGTAQEPVHIYSVDHAAHGVLVLNTKTLSRIEHCRFERLSNPNTYGWAVSGAVNFYDAPVRLYNCVFKENRCEDALNIIKTTFEMDNVIFEDIQADAFDGDFVEGSIKNCLFGNIGNDAIDVSGSILQVENVTINNAGDKGLSAGENSEMTATKVIIKNCEIALASKDHSILKVSGALISDNKLGFTAFQKKPEFGAARIEVSDTKLENNATLHLIETKSSLLLNGQVMETTDGVIERMYGDEFGKKSQ